jgi:transcriptional regulator with XRE-family HTH domain
MECSVSVTTAVLRPLSLMTKRPKAAPRSVNVAGDVADRLRWLRIATTGSAQGAQAEFCRMTGITQQQWNNFERGVALISLPAALKLCTSLGVTLDWIYRGVMSSSIPDELKIAIRRVERETSRQTA